MQGNALSRRGAFAALAGAFLAPAAAMAGEGKKDINDCGKGWVKGRLWLTGKSCQEKGKVRGVPMRGTSARMRLQWLMLCIASRALSSSCGWTRVS